MGDFGLSTDDDDLVYPNGQADQSSGFWNGVSNYLDKFSVSLGNGLKSLTNPIGTGENAKNGLDYIGGVGSALFNYWKFKKALSLAEDSQELQKNTAINNATSSAATQLANGNQLAIMASDFNKDYGAKVAQNYANLGQTVTNAVGSLGGDTSGLQNQVNSLKKYSALS